MRRRPKIKNHWGHRYPVVGFPKQEPTPEGFGLSPGSIDAVREWQSARTQFVAEWGLAAVLLVSATVVWIWGTEALSLELAFGSIPLAFVLGALHSWYGSLPEEDQVAEFKRAYDLWLRLGRPLSEHKRHVAPWTELSGHGFERAVTRIFKGCGFDARKTRGSGDGGIDVEIFKEGKLYAVVQCKRYKDACGPAVVRELYGAMMHRGAARAVLVCLGGFTPAVEQFAKGKPISLIDSKLLLEIRDGGAAELLGIL